MTQLIPLNAEPTPDAPIRRNVDEKRRIYESAAPEAREIFDLYRNSHKKIRDQVWQLVVLANADGQRNLRATRKALNLSWANGGDSIENGTPSSF